MRLIPALLTSPWIGPNRAARSAKAARSSSGRVTSTCTKAPPELVGHGLPGGIAVEDGAVPALAGQLADDPEPDPLGPAGDDRALHATTSADPRVRCATCATHAAPWSHHRAARGASEWARSAGMIDGPAWRRTSGGARERDGNDAGGSLARPGRRARRGRPDPEPRARASVLLRVSWCGICGTDVEEYRDGPVVIPVDGPNPLTGQCAPVTLGHEFAGEVVEVGAEVRGLAVGDRVVPDICLFCGECHYCRRHEYALCLDWAAIGLHGDGGLAEYVRVPARQCVRLPDAISDEEAALIETIEVAVRAIRHAGVRLGDSVAIVGDGAVGLITLQVARAAGATKVILLGHRAGAPGPRAAPRRDRGDRHERSRAGRGRWPT